jgi:RecA/RadA recombinase
MNKELEQKNGQIKPKISTGLDIDKLIKKAQDSYSKKDIGLAKQLSTGKSIILPTEDKDFVVWTGNSYWQDLTSLKGLPFSRIVQISGKIDSGKSTNSMNFMKFAQDQGVLVILWDSERKFSSKRFDERMGGDSSQLAVVNTNKIIDGAKAVAQIIHAAKDQNPDCKILIVWDSVGASLNSTEDSEEDENYSMQPGVSAKENSYAIKKFNKLANKYITQDGGGTIAILVINQVYQSIGIGAPVQIEKGGQEISYLSSVIVQLSRKQDLTRISDGDKYKYGILSRAKVKKNHLFSGNECIAELDIVISADGIQLAKDVKSHKDIQGWDDVDDND